MSISQALLGGLAALGKWQVLAMLGVYAVLNAAMLVGIGVVGSRTLVGGFIGFVGAAVAEIVLMPVFLAAVAGLVVGTRHEIDIGYALEHLGSLMFAGFIGWLMPLLLGFVPILGAFMRSRVVSDVVAAIPVALAILAPDAGLRVATWSLELLALDWLFLLAVIAAAKGMEVAIAVLAGAIGFGLNREAFASGELEPISIWLFGLLNPLITAYPVFVILHRIMQYVREFAAALT